MSPDKRPPPGGNRAHQVAPEPWASAMVDAGLVHHGVPSITALAKRARDFTGSTTPSLETTRRWVFGMRAGNIGPLVAESLAQALKVPTNTVLEWTGTAGAKREQAPWTPPPVSSRLTSEQRKNLDQLVRLFAHANDELAKARGESRGDTAPMNVDVTDEGDRLVVEAGDADAPPRPGDPTTHTGDPHRRKRDDSGT